MKWREWAKWSLLGLVAVLAVIQLVPYGRAHDNPRVVAEPLWDSPATRELAVRACYDCHSNETVWSWYTNIAPISWLTTRDVEEGRQKLNFSEWGSGKEEDETVEVVLEGEMPPVYYGWVHPSARLTDRDIRQLADGLRATVGTR